MTSWMLHGDDKSCGALTSGGTESILMAIKAYRERAKKLRPYVTKPNMIVPTTIHPAFEKAGHYFGVELIHIDLDPDMRVNVKLVEKAINRNTILLVGSAPQYCHGVVDPISELSDIALRHGLPLHVDACFGGFMLPWLEKLGYKIPTFDFRIPGVTSMSADVHKYGYSSKGASVILYRNEELRSHQYFAYGAWPGGLFGSPSLTGSRPGGMIAAAWAALVGKQLREKSLQLMIVVSFVFHNSSNDVLSINYIDMYCQCSTCSNFRQYITNSIFLIICLPVDVIHSYGSRWLYAHCLRRDGNNSEGCASCAAN